MRLLVAILVTLAAAVDSACAGFTSLGPTSYLSKADSPFPVDGSNPNFFLEDFEDGELNTLGIFQPLAAFTHGIVIEGSSPEVSVDGHGGGLEDGKASGRAIRSNFSAFRPTDPVISTSYLRFAFDESQLGWLPDVFGFAWTTGPVKKIIRIGAFDDQSNLLQEIVFDGINDEGFPTEPAHFLGGRFDSGIHLIEISVTYEGSPEPFVVDHVQYGLLVPEPIGFALYGIGLLGIAIARRRSSYVCATLALAFIAANNCHAGFTFLGPTPYLSKADSSFPVDGSNPNFFLEDFEDGELNTPGIFQPLHHLFGTAFHGEVTGPSEFTDSVDGDDEIIDGSGTAGHSFRSRALFVSPTSLQRNTVEVKFEFEPMELGYLPNAFGFVWTDGPVGIDYFRPGLDLRVVVTDSTGNRFLSPYVKLFANIDRNGKTSEDVFLGVIADMPISEVTIGGIYYGESETMPYLEIDHVQYGRFIVPEPGTYSLAASLLAMLAIWRLTLACRTIGVL